MCLKVTMNTGTMCLCTSFLTSPVWRIPSGVRETPQKSQIQLKPHPLSFHLQTFACALQIPYFVKLGNLRKRSRKTCWERPDPGDAWWAVCKERLAACCPVGGGLAAHTCHTCEIPSIKTELCPHSDPKQR